MDGPADVAAAPPSAAVEADQAAAGQEGAPLGKVPSKRLSGAAHQVLTKARAAWGG
jgi:hypothetical protein